MILDNLLGLSLEAVVADASAIQRLLEAAIRSLADSRLAGISPEGRFDMAYKAIMQSAMVALHANGYRPLTSRPGHHQTAIQSLTHTIGLPADAVIVLDALRKQRNLSDDSGDLIPDAVAAECMASAQALQGHVLVWLKAHRPDMLSG